MTNLFATITNFEHLLTAYGRARRGKRHKTSVGHYDFHLENKIISLRRELLSGNYKPSPYAHFTIYDPKTRQVSAPAFSDRVLHHSLVAAIESLFERQFIVDSYACRVDKGTHFGAQRVKKFLMVARTKHGSDTPLYVLQCDIRKYFQSVDWDILLSIVGRTIHCPDTLKVIRTIVTSQIPLVVSKAEVGQQLNLLDVLLSTPSTVSVANRVGLPIGNLTSQLFANVYLNQLDHFVKDELGVRWYGRYMDDFLIIHPDKEYLKGIHHRIEDYLSSRLRLRLQPRKVSINNVSLGVPFVGYRIYYDHMVMRNSTLLHMQRRHSRQQQLVERGSMELERLLQMEQSIKGFCRHANAWGLGDKLWPNVVISDVEPVNDTK